MSDRGHLFPSFALSFRLPCLLEHFLLWACDAETSDYFSNEWYVPPAKAVIKIALSRRFLYASVDNRSRTIKNISTSDNYGDVSVKQDLRNRTFPQPGVKSDREGQKEVCVRERGHSSSTKLNYENFTRKAPRNHAKRNRPLTIINSP